MAISVIGTPISAAATTVTPATHAIGDYIVIVAMRSAVTAPTLPAGYTTIATGSGNTNSYRVGYKIATSTTDASGTWTNASLLLCTVYRGVSGIGTSSAATHAAATTTAIPTISLANQNSKSWVVAFAGHAATSTQGTPLAGATTLRVTQTAGTYNAGMFDTNAGTNSFSATTSSNTTSVVNAGGSFELLSTDAISTFSDPMTASTQDTTKWQGNFGTLSWSPSGLTITNPISYTGYGGEMSTRFFDLTGGSFTANMPTAGNQSLTSCETVPFALMVNSTTYLEFYINAGFLFAQQNVNGTSTANGNIAYVPATMSWFKLSESGGTITWQYGSNGTTWTTLGTVANPFPVTALQVQPSLGTFNAEASSTTAVWNSFNTSSSVNATVTQVAANVTAAGGTQTVSAVVIANASVSQVAANVTATGGTQSIATINDVSIAQVHGTLTATGGTQVIATQNFATIAQLAANLTASGGTQAVSAGAVASASISQVAASVTATGGTQVVATVNDSSISQVHASITATGGTQAIVTQNFVTIAQIAATVTATGGTQAVAAGATSSASISQVAANVTAHGGTQVIASVQKVAVAQVHGTLTTTGGTQVVASIRDVTLAQLAAILTATGGTPTLVVIRDVAISQQTANLILTGGLQIIRTVTPVQWVSPTITISSSITSFSDSSAVNIANVAGGAKLDNVSSSIKTEDVSGAEIKTSVSGSGTETDI